MLCHIVGMLAESASLARPAPSAWIGGWARNFDTLDRLAMGLSGLCLVHCLGTALFFASLASVGGMLNAHWVHEVGLVLAISFALLALVRGVYTHGFLLPFGVGCFGLGMMAGALTLPHGGDELIATIVGVLIVAFGHDLNQRARQ
jgi:MerC mercury resistance protein